MNLKEGNMEKRKKSKLWTLLLIASICYFAYTMYRQQIYIEDRNAHNVQLQKEIYSETIKNEQLMQQKKIIGTNEFVEKVARDNLGYVKDGEKIYVDTNR